MCVCARVNECGLRVHNNGSMMKLLQFCNILSYRINIFVSEHTELLKTKNTNKLEFIRNVNDGILFDLLFAICLTLPKTIIIYCVRLFTWKHLLISSCYLHWPAAAATEATATSVSSAKEDVSNL